MYLFREYDADTVNRSSKSPAPGGRPSSDFKSPPRIDSPLGSER